MSDKKIKVKKLVPHPGPHFDEAALAAIIVLFGKEKFDIDKGVIICPGQLLITEEAALANGLVPLGQLKGQFDDKYPDGGRMENTCCAIRGAEWLGVEKRPEVKRILSATLRVDSEATASPSSLATLMKMMMSSLPLEVHPRVFAHMMQAAIAIIQLDAVEGSLMFDSLVSPLLVFGCMVKERGESGCPIDMRIIQRIRHQLGVSMGEVDNMVLELAHAGFALKVNGMSNEKIVEWYQFVLDKWVQQQEEYLAATKLIRSEAVFTEIPNLSGRICYIESDSMQVNSASRRGEFGTAVTIVRKSNGNVSIFPNNKYGLDMRGVWALLRIQDADPSACDGAVIDDYVESGNHPDAPMWHMMESGATLNGTNFIKAVPTRMDGATVVRMVLRGLSDEARRAFELIVQSKSPKKSTVVSEGRSARPYREAPKDKEPKGVSVHCPVPTIDDQARQELSEALDG